MRTLGMSQGEQKERTGFRKVCLYHSLLLNHTKNKASILKVWLINRQLTVHIHRVFIKFHFWYQVRCNG